MSSLRALICTLVVALASSQALAEEREPASGYPDRPITIVVPSPPGGGIDMVARLVGGRIAASLHAQVVIDNRPSGGGLLGTRAVANATPDGYTLLLGHTGTISINPNVYVNAGYDPQVDFAPIGLVAMFPIVLAVHPSLPVTSVADFIALARRKPGTIMVGTSVIGSGGYLAAELFKYEAGIDVTIVPYKGAGPLANDLLGGHVTATFNGIAPLMGVMKNSGLRGLGVASLERMKILPELPTMDESGLPRFEAILHYGLLAPAGTPSGIVTSLNRALREMAAQDDAVNRIASDGGAILFSSPEEYAATIDRERVKWGVLVKQLGLKME